jgi:hypothetical protein
MTKSGRLKLPGARQTSDAQVAQDDRTAGRERERGHAQGGQGMSQGRGANPGEAEGEFSDRRGEDN